MCDTRFHEHWCSGCGKNLNKEPMDSYVEIEWSQNEQGEIIHDKKMICKTCLEDMPNVKALNEFFSTLQYQHWGHVFCSSCKKDLTKEYMDKNKRILPTKLTGPLTGLRAGIDYECLEFKEHKDKKHFIKVVVLCLDCKKEKFNLEHLEELKKLGRNPLFKPTITCPNTEKCNQFKKGDNNINCRNIVIGRDRDTLSMALLCGRKHKGALPMPFDDGIAITRPRKGKGAALSNVPVIPSSTPFGDYFKEFEKVLEKFLKKNKLGAFAEPVNDGRFFALETRLAAIENTLGIHPAIVVPTRPEPIISIPLEPEKKKNSGDAKK